MSSEQSVQMAESLLNAFHRDVPTRCEPPPTFMQITRYPHYEDVCSNILAFFLDPGKPHGLGSLFLDALACVGGIEDQEWRRGNVEVDREVSTRSGKLVDILIESRSHAILIENKIRAGFDYNPFREYASHLDQLEQPHKHKFLLTLKPVGEDAEFEIGHGFKNITHRQLVSGIRRLLGSYVAEADTRYLTFMLDFLNTLGNLEEGKVMNPEFVEFLQPPRQEQVEEFLHQIGEFKRELRSKATELMKHIRYNSKSYPNVEQPGLWREASGLCDVLYFGVKHSSFAKKIQMDLVISPEGWTVHIFPWQGSAELEKLKSLLHGLQMQIKKEEEGRFTLEQCYEYADPNLNRIAREVEGVLDKLARSGRPS